MRVSEALQAVEDRAARVGMADYFGDALLPIEAVAECARLTGPEWRDVEDLLVAKKITAHDFYIRCLSMIEEVEKYVNRRRIEMALLKLGRKQAEAGCI